MKKTAFLFFITFCLFLVSVNSSNAMVAKDGHEIILKKGDSFIKALKNFGISESQIYNLLQSVKGKVNFNSLRAGDRILLETVDDKSNEDTLKSVILPLEDCYIQITNDNKNVYNVRKLEHDDFYSKKELVKINLNVDSSIFRTLQNKNFNKKSINVIAESASKYLNCNTDIKPGSKMEVLAEGMFDQNNKLKDYGDILYVGLKAKGKSSEDEYYLQMYEHSGKLISTTDKLLSNHVNNKRMSGKIFVSPVKMKGVRISSHYGSRLDPVAKQVVRKHNGIDLAVCKGTPVYAASDGVVEFANRNGSYGNFVKIGHAKGFSTCYAHLDKISSALNVGKKVKTGQLLGYSGNTGRVAGAHLHFEVRYNNQPIDPVKFINFADGHNLKQHYQDPISNMNITELRSFKQAVGTIRQAHLNATDVTSFVL